MVRRFNVNYQTKACENIQINEITVLEEHSDAIRTKTFGLCIAIIVISSIVILISILFFLLKNTSPFNKNPVKIVYIIFLSLVVLCILVGSFYLYHRKDIEDGKKIYDSYLDNRCFTDKALKTAFHDLSDYAQKILNDFSTLSIYLFVSAISAFGLAVLLSAYKKGTYGGHFFDKPW